MTSLPLRASSAWDLPSVEQFLASARLPLRLACHGPGGAPLVCSLWFLYADGYLWCATSAGAALAGWLAEDQRCGFEISVNEVPYRGVRGQGAAVLLAEAGADVLGRLIDRYLGDRESRLARWLLRRADEELAIRIEPRWITAWDFTERMRGV